MQPHERVTRSLKQIIVNNFVGGIAWGLGATIGLSIVVALLSVVLRKLDLVPLVGDFVSQVMQFIAQRNPNLIQ